MGLRDERRKDSRMTVTLVDGTVSAEHVDVFTSFRVPDFGTECAVKHAAQEKRKGASAVFRNSQKVSGGLTSATGDNCERNSRAPSA